MRSYSEHGPDELERLVTLDPFTGGTSTKFGVVMGRIHSILQWTDVGGESYHSQARHTTRTFGVGQELRNVDG
jgi:hypothetical protein